MAYGRRREGTDRLLILGERHLLAVLTEYARHYNQSRPHRALAQQPPNQIVPVDRRASTKIERRSILGGLVNEYTQAA